MTYLWECACCDWWTWLGSYGLRYGTFRHRITMVPRLLNTPYVVPTPNLYKILLFFLEALPRVVLLPNQ